MQRVFKGTIMKIAISVGILAAALVALSTIDPDKLVSSLSAIYRDWETDRKSVV